MPWKQDTVENAAKYIQMYGSKHMNQQPAASNNIFDQ